MKKLFIDHKEQKIRNNPTYMEFPKNNVFEELDQLGAEMLDNLNEDMNITSVECNFSHHYSHKGQLQRQAAFEPSNALKVIAEESIIND